MRMVRQQTPLNPRRLWEHPVIQFSSPHVTPAVITTTRVRHAGTVCATLGSGISINLKIPLQRISALSCFSGYLLIQHCISCMRPDNFAEVGAPEDKLVEYCLYTALVGQQYDTSGCELGLLLQILSCVLTKLLTCSHAPDRVACAPCGWHACYLRHQPVTFCSKPTVR